MKKRNGILTGLLAAVCAACLIPAAGCSQSLLENNVGFTAGRTSATVIAVTGLISLVIGALAFRAAGRIGTGKGRAGALAALVMGLIVMILSVVHLGRSTGGFGTGSGRAGAIVALVLGLISISFGGLALARLRRFRGSD